MDNENMRIEIGDLPQAEAELTDDEAKQVEGGTFYGTGVYKSTDSGRTVSGNTSGGSLSVDQSNQK